MRSSLTCTASLALSVSSTFADIPSLGGPMSHLLVTLFQNQIYVTLETPSMATVLMQDNDGSYTGNADALNHQGYNGQFGWLANGFISLPPSSGIFVRTVSSSQHLSVYEQGTFDEILGTGESENVWQWDGTMTHNWYATDTQGVHHASYEVFVGDLAGNPLGAYQPGTVDLVFHYGRDPSHQIGILGGSVHSTPAPGVLSMVGIGALGISKRKR